MTSFDRRGEGSPLVLLHGIGSHWQIYEPVIDALAQVHDVIAVDLPGFGGTRADPDILPDVAGYAGWLAEFLSGQGVERPHVVGNSMGGRLALELGRTGVAGRVTAFSPAGFWGRPGLFWTRGLLSGLRLAAVHAGPVVNRLTAYGPTRSATLAPLFGRPQRVTREEANSHIGGLVEGKSFPEVIGLFPDYTFHAPVDVGRLTEVPVTVAWGTRDVTLLHRTQSVRARQLLPFAHHVDLAGCGHLPFSDDPARCVTVILEEPS